MSRHSLDEHSCPVPECEYTGSKKSVDTHVGIVHDEIDPVVKRIVELLDKRDELSGPKIRSATDASDSKCENKLAALQRDGRLESRLNPENKNQKLYQLADSVDPREFGIDDTTDTDGQVYVDGQLPGSDPGTDVDSDDDADDSLHLSELGITERELVDALDGAAMVRQVAHSLNLRPRTVRKLVDELGLTRQFSGRSQLDREVAEDAVSSWSQTVATDGGQTVPRAAEQNGATTVVSGLVPADAIRPSGDSRGGSRE